MSSEVIGAIRRIAKPTIAIDRVWIGFLVGLALLMAGFLVGPRVTEAAQDGDCVGNVNLLGPFGFALNCDSPEFMWLARDPSGLLVKESQRQSRPGLIIAAAALQAPLSFVMPQGGPPLESHGRQSPEAITKSFANNPSAYLAYVILNVAILLASLHFLRKVFASENVGRTPDITTTLVVLATGLLLLANDVTKAFVWSPHTQMFNVFVPIFSLYVTLRLLRGGLRDRPFILWSGLAAGLGVTAYPFFAVVIVCAIPPAIWSLLSESTGRRAGALNLASFIALGVAPSLLWYEYVVATTGEYYQHEMAIGEVTWMSDALAQGLGVFLSHWWANLWVLLGYAATQAIALVVAVAWLAFVAYRNRSTLRVPRHGWLIPAVALYVSVASLGFYTSIGWIVERLAYPAIPTLIAGAGALALLFSTQLPDPRQREMAFGLLIIALAQMVYVVAKGGPWS